MPTYSEVTITFTNDWVNTDDLKLSYNDNGSLSNQIWTWVSSRSSGFEVSTGIPTANPGETSAINFKAAFDLDNATGYVTAVGGVDGNEVLIQSETLGEDFTGFAISVGTNTATVVFNNYSETPTSENVDYALVRSPYYVNIPFDFTTTTSATISLYVWDGDLATVPTTATRTLTKTRPSIDYAEFNVDLSKISRDSFNPKPVLDLTLSSQIVDSLDGNVKWLKYTASYTDPSETIADIEGTLAAIEGYGYMQEGVNPTVPASKALTSCANRKVERGGFIIFPFLNEGTITSIEVDSSSGTFSDVLTPATSDESTDAVQYACVDVSTATVDDYITITLKPGNQEFVYQVVDECRYEPLQVVFLNKYGAFDSITMFKKRTNELRATNEEFKNNYILGGTYDITNHQMQKLNVVGNDTFKLNSGYIDEDENALYKELILSELVYLYENSSFVPVNVDTKSIEFKDRVNNSLTQYTIDFAYAFNTINNI
jgi:hypothetical protein